MTAIVPYGRVSGAMPGISPRFSGLSRGGRTRRRRRSPSSSACRRSIFGARLRTRWPQYGHSVTYGLTSDEQFLQTTKRSGSLTRTRIPAGHRRAKGVARLSGRLLDDLADDLAEGLVRLPHDHLPRGAVGAVEQAADPDHRALRAELLGVVAHPPEHPHAELARIDALGLRQVPQLLVDPLPRGDPLVLVEHLVRVG